MVDNPQAIEPEALLRHGDFVRALSRSLIRDEHRAEDIAQETWLAALKRPPETKTTGALRSWLGVVARNLAFKSLRKDERRLNREYAAATPEGYRSTENLLELEAVRKRVVEAVISLKEPYRSAILYRYYDDLLPREIAARLSMPVSTVKTQIQRGLEKLRSRLDGESGGSRKSWCLALAPIAGIELKTAVAGAAAAGGTTAGLPAVFSGVFAMSVKGKTLLAAVVIILLSIPVALILDTKPTETQPTQRAWVTQSEEKKEGPALVQEANNAEISRQPLPPTAVAGKMSLRGRVVDSEGNPLEKAMIHALWWIDPSKKQDSFPITTFHKAMFKSDSYTGIFAYTNAEGQYDISFEYPGRCYVYLNQTGDPYLSPFHGPYDEWTPWQGRWVNIPSENVDFTAEYKPTAKVIVRAVEESTGAALVGFGCTFWSKETKNYYPGRTEGSILEMTLPAEVGKVSTYHGWIKHPAAPEGLEEVFEVEPGAFVEVVFKIPEKVEWEIRGVIVDADGIPVEGALVYLGNQIRMRGDEPFKPFEENRIKDGVRSDADGVYLIKGRGRKITAWHPEYVPVTVPLSESDRIQLPSKGSIRGRLFDVNGIPVADAELVMDRTRKARTDSSGGFVFEGLEAGVRGIRLPGAEKSYVGIRLSPGEDLSVEIRGFLPKVTVELYADGVPFLDTIQQGCLIGLDRVFNFPGGWFEGTNGRGVVENILPGRYLLLTRSGRLAHVEINGTLATADFGRCDLTVKAAPGTRVYVVPEGADAFLQLMGGRHSSQRVMSASGEVTFSPLPEGTYDVGIDRKGIFATVEVSGPGTEVELPK